MTMTRRSEINWLDWGVRRYIPATFERFHAVAPEATNGIEMAAAFNQLMEDPDPEVRAKAAADWCEWENAVVAHEINGAPGSYSARVDSGHTGNDQMRIEIRRALDRLATR
ncbi:hypothetical protein ACIBLA_26590 [Streptomyces sp. NPDC050433]|uniref:hypothetical protein n=1 Tax=unclassified Streptomyces TaxID=2593676 RepID=UPI003416EE59